MKTIRSVAAAAGFTVALASSPPATADESSYINAVENAQLIDGDGNFCNGPNPVGNLCAGQFDSRGSALFVGYQICSEIALGRSRDNIIEAMLNGDGVGPNRSGMSVVYDLASAHLC